MKKTIFVCAPLALWALATMLTQPNVTLASAESERPILSGSGASHRIVAAFERSCQNCHSAKTQWPVYGRVFPITVLVGHDVREARAHMDLSRWEQYDSDRKRDILSRIGSMVRSGAMPPLRYRLLHPEAKLSPEEAAEIYQWTRDSRRRLKQALDREHVSRPGGL